MDRLITTLQLAAVTGILAVLPVPVYAQTSSPAGPLPEGGYGASMVSGSVRAMRAGEKEYVFVDGPMSYGMIRLHERPVFLTVPVGFSWGLTGGFSADTSIGVGLSWLPVRYVNVSAEARVGTFFLTNRTFVRSVAFEIHVPIRERFLVVGAEYFQRDAARKYGFMKGSQWYASGHGVGIRVGVRTPAWDR